MIKSKLILLSAALTVSACISSAVNMPPFKTKEVLFTIIDNENKPVSGASLSASYPGPGNATGVSDRNGEVRLKLAAEMSLFLSASKSGFYETNGEIWQGGMTKAKGQGLVAKEMPDSFEVVLKPVIEPVYMQHHRFRGYAPASDKPVGFDLQVGDWVKPHGKGETVDLYFHFHDIFEREEAFSGTMTLSFPNASDGIQAFFAGRPFSMEYGSNLAPPHKAPLQGYESTLSYSLAHREGEPYQAYTRTQRNYIFRTRTVTDANGKILQACYGWIKGEIDFDPRGERGPQLSFESYFNPDKDPEQRSLEYNLNIPKS